MAVQWGTVRKNYAELNAMVPGLYSPADISAGVDDLVNKVIFDLGVKLINAVDKVEFDLLWHSTLNLLATQKWNDGTLSFLARVKF